MADEDDKVRRNVVVSSAIVISIAWLQIPIKLLGSKYVAIPSSDFGLDPFRIWSLIAVVFLYLLLRFKFVPETDRYISQFYSRRLDLQKNGVAKKIEKALRKFSSSGKEGSMFEPSLSEYIERKRAGIRATGVILDDKRPIVESGIWTEAGNWSYSLSPNLIWNSNDKLKLMGNGQVDNLITFTLKGWSVPYIYIISWLHAFVYTEFGLRYVYPLALWAIAMTVVVWEIYVSAV